MKKQQFCLSMLVLVSIILAPLLTQGVPPAVTGTISRVHNTKTPHNAHQILHPQELWRRGGQNDDFLFGFIITAEIDAEDNTYLLDRWLGTIYVLGPDGKPVRQLSREGEGPGETKQPTDLTWLPNGELGITQPLPGRLIRIDRDGNPAGDLVPAGVSAREAEFGFLTETTWRGGTLAYSGSQTNFRKGQMEVSNFLAVCDPNTGAELARILEKQSSNNQSTAFRETDYYWINEGRWCLGPDGKIYTAPQRDAYAIHVYSSDGRLERIIERDFESRRRTMDEMTALQDRHTRPEGEWGGGREVHISVDEPCLSELRVAENGELWVRHSCSSHHQAPGVFATWDVFDTDGQYSRAVSIAIPGEPDSDRLLFLGDNRLLLICGFNEASDAMWGQGETEDQELVGEIVFFDMAP